MFRTQRLDSRYITKDLFRCGYLKLRLKQIQNFVIFFSFGNFSRKWGGVENRSPDMLDPQTKSETNFYVFLSWIFFINYISSTYMRRLERAALVGKPAIYPSPPPQKKRMIDFGFKEYPLFGGFRDSAFFFRACNVRL